MRDLSLLDFFILGITLYDSQYKNGHTEVYSISAEDQKEAFEILEGICKEENVVASLIREPKEEKVLGLVGPKRLEITLRTYGGVLEKKLVVTDIIPPVGYYKYYTVSGRIWEVYHKRLKATPETFWATGHWLARIDAFLGGSGGSSTDHFTPQERDQEHAWASLEKTWNKFQPAEIHVIKNWPVEDKNTPIVDDDVYGGEWYGPNTGNQHWTGRVPSAYEVKPTIASFRVAGDEVGAIIFREQQTLWESAGGAKSAVESLAGLLETKIRIEKKREEVGSASEVSGSRSAIPLLRRVCTECGGYSCPESLCIDELDFATFGGSRVADGRFTIH